MRATVLSSLLLLSACWKIDAVTLSDDSVLFSPEVGAPDDWVVQRFPLDLECPDGEPAAFWLVYPQAAADTDLELPLAILFHSGAFDYVLEASAGAPLDGVSYQQTVDGILRLDTEWSFRHVFTTLGLYPNYDTVEVHAGALPAALATKGVASMIPSNCWGDLWHNRPSIAENNYEGDWFQRRGRTAAEFAVLHATTEFPPGNPLTLPVGFDLSRIYYVGLGEGARAVTELLAIDSDGTTVGPYGRAAAVVLDSPIDDLRAFWPDKAGGAPCGDPTDDTQPAIRTVISGLSRVFPEGCESTPPGSLGHPATFLPPRVGLLYSTNDTRLPGGANAPALARMADEAADHEMWVHEAIEPEHVITNADVVLAKAVADFLTEGLDALDPGLIDGP